MAGVQRPRLADRLAEPRVLPWLRRVTTAVLVLGLVACASEAGSGPADPTLLPPGETQGPVTSSTVVTTRVPLPGFDEVAIQVTTVDGEVRSWCLLLAATPEQWSRGLMEVTDPELGGYDGMLFRFDAPNSGGFYMRNTPQPLSIAFVAADGTLVSAAEMVPCADVDGCPTTVASGPYLWAVEVPTAVGGVSALGLEPGSLLVDLQTGCSAPD